MSPAAPGSPPCEAASGRLSSSRPAPRPSGLNHSRLPCMDRPSEAPLPDAADAAP